TIVLMEKGINAIFTYYEKAGGLGGLLGDVFEKTMEYGPLAIRLAEAYFGLLHKIGNVLAATGETVSRLMGRITRDPERRSMFFDMAHDLSNLRHEMGRVGEEFETQAERTAKAVSATNREFLDALEELDKQGLSGDAYSSARSRLQANALRRLAERMLGDASDDVLSAWDTTPGASGGLGAAKQRGIDANRGRMEDTLSKNVARIATSSEETAANTAAIRKYNEFDERIRRRGAAFAPAAVEMGYGMRRRRGGLSPIDLAAPVTKQEEEQRRVAAATRGGGVGRGGTPKTGTARTPTGEPAEPLGDVAKIAWPAGVLVGTALAWVAAKLWPVFRGIGRGVAWAGRGLGRGMARGWGALRGRFGGRTAATPPELPVDTPTSGARPGARVEGRWGRGHGTRRWRTEMGKAAYRSADANVARLRTAWLEGRGTGTLVDSAQLEANLEAATRARADIGREYELFGRRATRGATRGAARAGLRGAGAIAARGAGLVGTALLATELLYGVIDAGADISDRIKVGDKRAAWQVGLAHGYKWLADLVGQANEMSKVTQWIPGGGGPLLGNLQRQLGGHVEGYLRETSTLAAGGIGLTHTIDTALQGISDWLHRPKKDKLDIEVTVKDEDGRGSKSAQVKTSWQESSAARKAFSSTV
ncbi:MAG: hypothetical protein GX358_05940, partial [candidate division WS1 bacterium]|nr:hypothetical protein [candidate division WS1 bacterium]